MLQEPDPQNLGWDDFGVDVVIEATGSSNKLEALLEVLQPFGIREIARAGTLALGRGSKSITDRALRH